MYMVLFLLYSSRARLVDGVYVCLLTSPPQSSQMAAHARGASSEASKVRCEGMLVRRVCHVDLSSGSMPRRVHTFCVTSAACSLLNACGILYSMAILASKP